MIDPYPLRSGALLSGTALCPIKVATPKRQITVKGPVASIRIQKQPSQPYPVAKPQRVRWIVTINPHTTVDAVQADTALPIIDHQIDVTPIEPQTKLTTLIVMLRREGGATIGEMAEATAWKVHSVRGAMSGILKKKLGLEIASEKVEDRGRVYRVI